MGEVVALRLTKRKVLRDALREIQRMYALSHGGEDPIASDSSRELFEMGVLDEMEWQDWATYCAGKLNNLGIDGD